MSHSSARHQGHGHGHGHHGHSHNNYGHSPPMVGHGLTRGQFAKIIFPSAVSLIIFIAYSILVHIYSFNLDTKELPLDAILFCIFMTLLISSFLRYFFCFFDMI